MTILNERGATAVGFRESIFFFLLRRIDCENFHLGAE